MKKTIYSVAALLGLMFSTASFAQLTDEKNVTITMDLQPILKLDMTSGSNLDFTFDNITSYVAGVTKYGATTLKVSSSVNWDLYAVGVSSEATGVFMDNPVSYGTSTDANAVATIPMDILELRQSNPNFQGGAATGGDYSSPFSTVDPLTGLAVAQDLNTLNILNALTPYSTIITPITKMIQGTTDNAGFGVGGSYMTALAGVPTTNYFEFAIDYRILPSLPATFPMAASATAIFTGGVYAKPGAYTMDVKYVLTENQ